MSVLNFREFSDRLDGLMRSLPQAPPFDRCFNAMLTLQWSDALFCQGWSEEMVWAEEEFSSGVALEEVLEELKQRLCRLARLYLAWVGRASEMDWFLLGIQPGDLEKTKPELFKKNLYLIQEER